MLEILNAIAFCLDAGERFLTALYNCFVIATVFLAIVALLWILLPWIKKWRRKILRRSVRRKK